MLHVKHFQETATTNEYISFIQGNEEVIYDVPSGTLSYRWSDKLYNAAAAWLRERGYPVTRRENEFRSRSRYTG
jgi:hypothetical protein